MVLVDAVNAIRHGQELQDPAKWKRGQNLTNAVGGLIAALVGILKWKFPDFELPSGMEEHFIEIVIGILVAANLYITTASSKKIGVGKKDAKKEEAVNVQ